MTRLSIALAALMCLAAPAQAHQIWIEQPDGGNAVIRFGEFGENLREASPGLLDKFVNPTGTLLSAKGETMSKAAKSSDGFTLPFRAEPGDSIVAEEAQYPLYTWKREGKDTINRYYPAARLITGFTEQQPKLTLDLVPTGEPGRLKLVFKGQPRAKTKVTLVTQSGWSKEAQTDDGGLVSFDMPWQGTYVAEVSVDDRSPGERTGPQGPERFDGTSYVTTLTYVSSSGLPPIPAGPPATPNK
ncbi:DUF4198 domain-containing protein [Enterovirga aerilata]|uniref:Cobalt ABC transporter substrate-binding protein n=1 Tax=Enterovirga aerilata TaxID=2730920 RepID=A0A849IDT8_9HYPH|nr:DUF4198 domain-containing protein [Enterovirga sp. DB1703]NNM74147.1 cobalt ABC transporter substrate-binding protein [Enterovirga sp. DB1703]